MWPGSPRTRHHAGRSQLLLLLLCALVALTAGVGAGLLLGRRALAGSGAKNRPRGSQASGEGTREPGSVVSLGELVVNLADTDTLRYIKVSVSLGLQERLSEEQIAQKTPMLRDVV